MKGCVIMTNETNPIISGIGKAIEKNPQIYDDALKPTAVETGKLAGRIPRTINAIFADLDKWILKREYSVEETKKLLEQKLQNIEPEKIVPPEPYVAVPAIQAISYSMDSDELRNMYANLLAHSMTYDTKENVHPGFVEIIRQLSPSDARYFKHLCTLKYRPMVDISLDIPGGLELPIQKNVNTFSKGYTNDFVLSNDNLCRLQLISIPNDTWYGDDTIYKPLLDYLKQEYTLEKYKHLSPNATNMSFTKSRIDITHFGKLFYEICVK